jgi:hypothetical protein
MKSLDIKRKENFCVREEKKYKLFCYTSERYVYDIKSNLNFDSVQLIHYIFLKQLAIQSNLNVKSQKL